MYAELSTGAISFFINDVATQTLSQEQMLWHIYRHSFASPLIDQSIRLIWAADFVTLVEKHLNEIDWDLDKDQYPQVWQILPVFHYLTPWSEKVINRLDIAVEPLPEGIGQTFQGWPQSSFAEQSKKGKR